MKFLYLHGRQKAFLLLFLSLFASCRRFCTDLQKFFCVYFIIYYAGWCDQDQAAVTGHTGKSFRQGYFNMKVLMCEYDIPYALEKIVIADLYALMTCLLRSRGKLKPLYLHYRSV